MKTMYPQKANKGWAVVSWDENALHIEFFRSFIGAAINYQRKVRKER